MIRSIVATVAAALAAATVGVAAPAVATPVPSTAPAGWSLGSPTATAPTMAGGRTVYTSDTAATAAIAVSPSSVESYAYWASGVRVTGAGFAPGESVVVTDTAPTGLRLTFETVPADANGTIDHVYTTEVNGAPVGQHLLRATGGTSGRTATTTLTVTANARQTLRVSVSPASIGQDRFIRSPVTMTAYGLAPRERLFVNLFGPDGSGQALGGDQALFADATGAFRYALTSTTAALPVGQWRVSVVANSGAYGSATYQVTPGPTPVKQGTLTFSPRILSTTQLSGTPLPWTMQGVGAFQAFDLVLTSPLGARLNIGTVRADGSGAHRDVLKANGVVDLGTYRLTATSRTTGNTASGTFIVTDDAGRYPPNASLTVSPRTLSAADAHTSGRGVVATVAHAPPGSFLGVSVTAPDTHFPALRDGTKLQGSMTLFRSIGSDGTAQVRVVFVRPQPAGTYQLDVYFDGGHLSTTVVVTA